MNPGRVREVRGPPHGGAMRASLVSHPHRQFAPADRYRAGEDGMLYCPCCGTASAEPEPYAVACCLSCLALVQDFAGLLYWVPAEDRDDDPVLRRIVALEKRVRELEPKS